MTGRRPHSRFRWRQLGVGLLFVSPWLIGFAAFVVYPLVYNIYLGFTEFSGFGEPAWVGLRNYQDLAQDDLFWRSLYNTLYYTLLAVPIGVVAALVLALAMNLPIREMPVYRAAIVLPSVLPAFALSFVFIWLLNPRYGLVNRVLVELGLPSINWLGDPFWAKFSIVLLAQMGAGQFALIFLAALRAIPQTLYDAARIDGANVLQRFIRITLPLMTPVFLYDVVVGLGLALQIFTPAYIMTGGGPADATLFYALYLYRNAFSYSALGYAAAMSTILFGLTLVVAVGVFRYFSQQVNYEVGA